MLCFRDKVTPKDPQNVSIIANSTGFFDKNVAEISVLIAKKTLKEHNNGDYKFLFADYNEKTVSYICFGRVLDSSSTYELYWMSTLNEYRGLGLGKSLMGKLKEVLKDLGANKVFVKTDSTDQYKPTRRFYETCGFIKEAILKEYYEKDNDCHIYSYKIE